MIKAVFFDVGGTIHTQIENDKATEGYKDRLYELILEKNICTPSSKEELFYNVEQGAKKYKLFTESKLVELPSTQIWREFMLKKYDVNKIKLSECSEDLSFLYDLNRKEIIKRQGLEDTLEALEKQGLYLGIISNIMSKIFVPYILRRHGVDKYFKSLILSSQTGIRKPNPKIFSIALKGLAISRKEACYVGDTISRDVCGARNAKWGMMIQIDNVYSYKRDKDCIGKGINPDYRIKDLKDIVSILT